MRMPKKAQNFGNDSKTGRKLISLVSLIRVLEPQLDKERRMLLQILCTKLTKKEIGRDEFARHVRRDFREERLRLAVLQLKSQDLLLAGAHTQVVGQQHVKMPTSSAAGAASATKIPLLSLLGILKPQLDNDKEMQLQTLTTNLRKKEIASYQFIRHLKNIIGEQMLRSAVLQCVSQLNGGRSLSAHERIPLSSAGGTLGVTQIRQPQQQKLSHFPQAPLANDVSGGKCQPHPGTNVNMDG